MTETVKLSVRTIHEKVYDWGIKNHKYPPYDNPEEEIKHYGKLIQYFNKRERRAFEDALDELERFFELYPTAREE